MAKTRARVPKGRRTRTGPTWIQRSRQESSEQKALYHHILGAGRRRVRREFFDLDSDDQDACRDGLERLVNMRLKKAGT